MIMERQLWWLRLTYGGWNFFMFKDEICGYKFPKKTCPNIFKSEKILIWEIIMCIRRPEILPRPYKLQHTASHMVVAHILSMPILCQMVVDYCVKCLFHNFWHFFGNLSSFSRFFATRFFLCILLIYFAFQNIRNRKYFFCYWKFVGPHMPF